MIERLHIQNFQAHADLRLSFSPQVNVLCGSSDRGKSSVLRAIRWLVTNKPAGDEFVKHGSQKTRVRLKLDGQTIVRERGKENTYKFQKETYKAFGSSVPAPIEEHLNLGEINFLGQHDSPFMFSLTPGEAARQLNRIVDLQVIDETVGKISADLRGLVAEMRVLENRKHEAQTAVSQLLWVEEALSQQQALQQRALEAARIEAECKGLSGAICEASELLSELEGLGGLVADGAGLQAQWERLTECYQQTKDLYLLLEDVKIAQGEAQIEVPLVEHLEALEQNAELLARKVAALEHRIDEVQETQEELIELASQLARWTTKLGEVKVCPTCGQELKT